MTPLLSLAVGIVVVFGITVLTGYFVAQEFAYISVDRSRLGSRAAAGDEKAERTLQITRRTSFMLSGAQLGITVTGLLVGYVAEPLIGQALAALLGVAVPAGVGVAIGGVVAILVSTIIQMLFGELFPKNYAIARSSEVADALTPSTRAYLWLFGPIITVFDKAAELLLRALRIEPVHDVESSASATDLERVVAASRAEGTLSADLAVALDRIIDFPRRDAEHAMQPRVRVDTVGPTATVGEVRALMATGHTRYPVIDPQERVIGVVHLLDVLGVTDPTTPVTAITRPTLVLPTFTPLTEAHDELRGAGQKLACVVDEFGSFVGVLTIEDLAEEIVGELTDEHDEAEAALVVADEGSYTIPGGTHVDEVERTLGVDLPEGPYETIAGLTMHQAERLLGVGEAVTFLVEPTPAEQALTEQPVTRRIDIEVLAVDRHVPATVRLTLTPLDHGEPA